MMPLSLYWFQVISPTGYFDHVRVLIAWCELRNGFRHFRADRINPFIASQESYPHRRQALLKAWRHEIIATSDC